MRLERDAANYHRDRHPQRQRAERARDRAGEAWCRDNTPWLRDAVWPLACLGDAWALLARHASAEKLAEWPP